MTGYASGQSSISTEPDNPSASTLRIGLEIRSVNSRFLDLSFKLQDDLREFEPMLRDQLNVYLKRGKVEVKASLVSSDVSAISDPSPKLLQRLARLEDNVKAWLPHVSALSVAEIMRLSATPTPPTAEIMGPITKLLKNTIDSLLLARAKEGARLASSMLERVALLKELVDKVSPIVPQLVEQQRLKFIERFREALGIASSLDGSTKEQVPKDKAFKDPDAAHTLASLSLTLPAQERALTEAANFAIRIDVAEELTRLSSHLSEIEQLLIANKNNESLGKRLDFLIQELHREANTLGSKSTSLELTRIGVDMKVLIEQLREQVQNIE
jgi:uncharacterized protein (TIGR00255 family)